MNRCCSLLATAVALGLAAAAGAYPGGVPTFQTDAAPFCAGCHSSREASALAGAGERATKETAEHKHISVILSGQQGYQSLSEPDRKTLAEQIRALDAASTIEMKAPPRCSGRRSPPAPIRAARPPSRPTPRPTAPAATRRARRRRWRARASAPPRRPPSTNTSR